MFPQLSDYSDGREAQYQGKSGLGMTEMRRRFCDAGWRFACNGVKFTGAASVRVACYRYCGSNIPTLWTPKPSATASG
jgi:RNA-directed DNA polymerase